MADGDGEEENKVLLPGLELGAELMLEESVPDECSLEALVEVEVMLLLPGSDVAEINSDNADGVDAVDCREGGAEIVTREDCCA